MKVFSMEMSYLMLSYPRREEQAQDLARGGGSCGDPSNDKARVMKTLGKKNSTSYPNIIEKKAMKVLRMEMSSDALLPRV
jgi:hypothetical protein